MKRHFENKRVIPGQKKAIFENERAILENKRTILGIKGHFYEVKGHIDLRTMALTIAPPPPPLLVPPHHYGLVNFGCFKPKESFKKLLRCPFFPWVRNPDTLKFPKISLDRQLLVHYTLMTIILLFRLCVCSCHVLYCCGYQFCFCKKDFFSFMVQCILLGLVYVRSNYKCNVKSVR